MSKIRLLKPAFVLALACAPLFTACAPLLIGTAAVGTAVVVADRRTTGMQLIDKTISVTTANRIDSNLNRDTTRVNAMSYNQRVLLTGEVVSQTEKDRATTLAKSVKDVNVVINELVIGAPASFETRTNDSWITSKIKSDLLITRGVPSATIDVTTSQGVVYLMGQVTQLEGDRAASAAAGVSGVKRVVKAFDIVSSTNASPSSSTASSTSTSAAGSNSTQTYPLK